MGVLGSERLRGCADLFAASGELGSDGSHGWTLGRLEQAAAVGLIASTCSSRPRLGLKICKSFENSVELLLIQLRGGGESRAAVRVPVAACF